MLKCFNHTLLPLLCTYFQCSSWDFCSAITIQTSNPCSLLNKKKDKMHHNSVSFQARNPFNQVYRWRTGCKMCIWLTHLWEHQHQERVSNSRRFKTTLKQFWHGTFLTNSACFVPPAPPNKDIVSRMTTVCSSVFLSKSVATERKRTF